MVSLLWSLIVLYLTQETKARKSRPQKCADRLLAFTTVSKELDKEVVWSPEQLSIEQRADPTLKDACKTAEEGAKELTVSFITNVQTIPRWPCPPRRGKSY